MRTISITVLTLLPSTAPCTTPGWSIGSGVSSVANSRSPSARSFCGASNRTTRRRPMAPFSDRMVPSPWISMRLSPGPSVMGAPRVSSTALPSASTRRPSWPRVKRPARVKRSSPAAFSTAKKPSPRNATSSGLPVVVSGPDRVSRQVARSTL
jgi:hypothetical protein